MIFTGDALSTYNEQGLFSRVMGLPKLANVCSVYFWPDTQHLFPVAAYRDRLVRVICDWAARIT
jgi:hypothetical protein